MTKENETIYWDDLSIRRTIYIGAALTLLFAPKIARSTVTYYVASFLCCILASIMVLAYVLSSFMPKFIIAPVYLTSWPFSVYIFYKFWQNIGLLYNDYFSYLVIYFAVVLLLSCAGCYRLGTPTDQRTLNLVQWGMQLCAMAVIYLSFPKINITIHTIIATSCFSLVLKLLNYVRDHYDEVSENFRLIIPSFRPKSSKLTSLCQRITVKEYQLQAVQNTASELHKLRQYVSDGVRSNVININGLRNADRMNSFINGKSDVSDWEVRNFAMYAKSSYIDMPCNIVENGSSPLLSNHNIEMNSASFASTLQHATPTGNRAATPSDCRFTPSANVSKVGTIRTPTTTPPPSSSSTNGSMARSTTLNGSAARLKQIASGFDATPNSNGQSPSTPLSSHRRAALRGSLRDANDGRPYNSPLVPTSTAVDVVSSRRSKERVSGFISSDGE